MVSSGQTSIRVETSNLNVSKGGATSLYVDQGHAISSDRNDGYSWDRPFKTISGAITQSRAWTTIWVADGTYRENVVIPYENMSIHGLIRDGPTRTLIAPLTGVPLTLNAGYCEVDNIALESINNHALVAGYPNHNLHDLYVEVNNVTATVYDAIKLLASSSSVVRRCYLQGNGDDKVVGIYVGGASVDVGVLGNYITGFGGAVNVGYGIALDDCQRVAILPEVANGLNTPNSIIDNNVGVYCYVQAGYRGHSIQHNLFAANQSYDGYDPNDPTVSGIVPRENCYAYNGWLEDADHDGRADFMVSWYNNYDYSPLSSPHTWTTAAVPRLNMI